MTIHVLIYFILGTALVVLERAWSRQSQVAICMAIYAVLKKKGDYVVGRDIVSAMATAGYPISYGTVYSACGALTRNGILRRRDSLDDDGRISEFALRDDIDAVRMLQASRSI
jgi:hypothetical protein